MLITDSKEISVPQSERSHTDIYQSNFCNSQNAMNLDSGGKVAA